MLLFLRVGILIIFLPEFAPSLGITEKLDASVAVACCYSGITVGSLASGFLSQMWGTRTKVVGLFMGASFLGVAIFLFGRGFSAFGMYILATFLGLATGYWAVFVTVAAEQFGTNLRATVGLVCFALAAISLGGLEDTHGRDLDFME